MPAIARHASKLLKPDASALAPFASTNTPRASNGPERCARAGSKATQEADIHALVEELERVSPDFKLWWRRHDVRAPCEGVRRLTIDGVQVAYEHTSLTIDADRHLRLLVYARQVHE